MAPGRGLGFGTVAIAESNVLHAPRRRNWALALGWLAIAAVPGPVAGQMPVRDATFIGPAAVGQAGQFITAALGYAHDYDPGRVVVEFVPLFERAFITSARFAPSLGHQVVLSKGENETDHEGLACAGFRITIEVFTAESLSTLARRPESGGLRVEHSDTVRGRVCVGVERVRVHLEDVSLARVEAGRPSFASPFAANTGGGT